jgi:tripartite-type tricarboxylate transporter receptor subunit TctC
MPQREYRLRREICVTDRATAPIGRVQVLPHSGFAIALALSGMLTHVPHASAQAYPTKPVRLIVPYPAGASITAREIANALAQALGQQFVVDHRPGAAATMGHTLVSKSAPDGYTIGIGTTGGLVSGPALLGSRIAYDPLKDFTHIGLATYIYYALFVNASSPAYSVADFIKLAKASPGKLNYSSPGVGTPNHIGGAQLVTLAGIDLLHVPYRGSGLSLSDLIAGTIHLTITGFSSTMPHIKAGRLRVLGVGHTQRIKFAPEVPAVNETVPGYYNTGWWGLIAPPGLPKPIMEKLNSIVNKALQSPEVAQRFFAVGLEAATSTPQGYTDLIRSDLQAWRKLITEAKISVDSLP